LSLSPAITEISRFLFVGRFETRLYVCQGFVAKNPRWLPIRDLATLSDTYTERFRS